MVCQLCQFHPQGNEHPPCNTHKHTQAHLPAHTCCRGDGLARDIATCEILYPQGMRQKQTEKNKLKHSGFPSRNGREQASKQASSQALGGGIFRWQSTQDSGACLWRHGEALPYSPSNNNSCHLGPSEIPTPVRFWF